MNYRQAGSNLTFNECYLLASMSGGRARRLVADANNRGRSVASESIDDVRVTLGWMDDYVTTGDRSFEDALDALLADLAGPTEPVKATKPVRRPAARIEPAPPTEAEEPASPRRERTKRDRDAKAARPSPGRKAG